MAMMATTTTMAEGLETGKKVLTMDPLGVNEVPAHPDLKEDQRNPPCVHKFVQRCYAEALVEMDKARKGLGEVKDKVSGVDVVVKKWKTEDEDRLTWFGRTSEHVEGSPVTFASLKACLMKAHEKNEAEYTPAIYDVNTLVEWDCRGMEFNIGEGEVLRDVEMRITQMHHSMPGGLLCDRYFSVLVLAFSVSPTQSLNVQIPINVPSLPLPTKSRSRLRPTHDSSTKLIYQNDNPDATPTQAQKSKSKKEVVQGSYVSVERIRLVRKEEGDYTIEWDMKTTSDAGGKLPQWAQKMGVPGAITKDVPGALRFVVGEKKEG